MAKKLLVKSISPESDTEKIIRLEAELAASEAEKEHAYNLAKEANASRGKKQKFRTVTTATPGAFHIGVAQMFTLEWLKNEYPLLVVSETPEMVVFESSLRDELVQRIRACFE